MKERKEIMKQDAGELEPTTWQAMKEQAYMLVKSGFLPTNITSAEKAVAIALSGRELGIGMMESFRSINIIQGKPTISPQLMLALANRTGELENIEIVATDEKCVVTIKRKRRSAYTNEFGVKEATDLQLMSKDNYRKQKKTMFQWRALAANLRVTFPDVVLGLYTPEEMGADIRVTDTNDIEVVENVAEQEEKPQTLQPSREPATFVPPVSTQKISFNEQKELFRLIKEKNVNLDDFQRFLVDFYGKDANGNFMVGKTADIRVNDYAKVTEWIITHEKPKEQAV